MTKDDVMDDSGLDREALKLMQEAGKEAGKLLCPPSGDGFWMRPLGDMLIVRQAKQKRRQSAVIEEVQTRELPWEGKVVAVSPKAVEMTGIAVGDTVLFSRHAGQEGITPMGYDDVYVQLHADEILSVLDVDAVDRMEQEHRQKEAAAAEARLAARRGRLDTGG